MPVRPQYVTANFRVLAGSARLAAPAALLADLGATVGTVVVAAVTAKQKKKDVSSGTVAALQTEWRFLCVAGVQPQQHKIAAKGARVAALIDPTILLPASDGYFPSVADLVALAKDRSVALSATIQVASGPAATPAARCSLEAAEEVAASVATPSHLSGRLVCAGCRVLLDPAAGLPAAIDITATEPSSSPSSPLRLTPSTRLDVSVRASPAVSPPRNAPQAADEASPPCVATGGRDASDSGVCASAAGAVSKGNEAGGVNVGAAAEETRKGNADGSEMEDQLADGVRNMTVRDGERNREGGERGQEGGVKGMEIESGSETGRDRRGGVGRGGERGRDRAEGGMSSGGGDRAPSVETAGGSGRRGKGWRAQRERGTEAGRRITVAGNQEAMQSLR